MIDFHSHILPGIDDGAKTVEDSINLIKEEMKQGVNTIVLTPHFYPDKQNLSEFLGKRDAAFKKLKFALSIENIDVELLLGAEVRFSRLLEGSESVSLSFGEPQLVMVELSSHMCPPDVSATINRIQMNGMIPILAHVDRYPYLYKRPDLLYYWVDAGAFAQFNVDHYLDNKETRSFVNAAIKHNLIHIPGTDTHSMSKRPPRMRECLHEMPLELKRKLLDNSEMLLKNGFLNVQDCTPMKKFFGWR